MFQLWVCGQAHLSTLSLAQEAMGTGHKPLAWGKLLGFHWESKKPKPYCTAGEQEGRVRARGSQSPMPCPHQGRNPARINSLATGKASARFPQHCGHQRPMIFLRCGFWKWPPEVWQTTEFLKKNGQGGDGSLIGGYESRAGYYCMGMVL